MGLPNDIEKLGLPRATTFLPDPDGGISTRWRPREKLVCLMVTKPTPTVRPLRHSMATISSRSKLGGPLSQSPLSDLILARRDSCRPCHRVTASYRALEPGKQPIVNNPLLLKTLPTTHLYIARDVPSVLFFFCRQPDHLTTCLSTCVYGKTICPSPHLAGSSTFCHEPSNIFPSSAYIAFSLCQCVRLGGRLGSKPSHYLIAFQLHDASSLEDTT